MQYGCQCYRPGLGSNGTLPAWSPLAVISAAFLGVLVIAWIASERRPA